MGRTYHEHNVQRPLIQSRLCGLISIMALWLFLAPGVAFGFVGTSLKNNSIISITGDRFQLEAETYRFYIVRRIDICPLSVTPYNNYTLFILSFNGIICFQSNVQCSNAVRPDSCSFYTDALVWFREILTVRDFFLKIINRSPSGEFAGPGRAPVVEVGDEDIIDSLPLRVTGIVVNYLRPSIESNISSQLLACVVLSICDRLPLLQDKKPGEGSSNRDNDRRNSERASPSYHLAIEVLGHLCILSGILLIVGGLWHLMIYSSKIYWRRYLIITMLGVIGTEVGLYLSYG
jgi:hypothetical protein